MSINPSTSAPTDKSEASERKLQVVMLAYPGMTLLDLVGPQATWGFHAQTHLVWETTDPIVTDSGVTLVPTTTFDACPQDMDILFVPGGFATWDVMDNPRALSFLQDRGQRAKLITSVCTGALILASADLLDGFRAATHWSTIELLSELGVQVVQERVVVDRNRITGAGVTAGIDFGLSVLAKLLGEPLAKATQLMLEYDPHPPFNAGSPNNAGAEVIEAVMGVLRPDIAARAMPAVLRAKKRRIAEGRQVA